MATLLASNRLRSLQRDLAVAIAAQIVDSWAISRGIVVGVVGGDGGCAGGWGLVSGRHCDFEGLEMCFDGSKDDFMVELRS